MNLRLLVPCAGLMGGLLSGWLARPGASSSGPAAPDKISVNAGGLNHSAAGTSTGAATGSGHPKLSELEALWTEKDGELTLYEKLAAVPADTLLARLNELMPPDACTHSIEEGKHDAVRNALVERLAELDPAALVGWLQRVPHGYCHSGWPMTAARALVARRSPEAAAQLALLEKEYAWVAEVRLDAQAEADPEGSLQDFLKGTYRFLSPALARWLVTDPARAMAFCNEHPEQAYVLMSKVAEKGTAALDTFAAGLTNPEAQSQLRRFQLSAAARDGDADAFARLLLQDDRNKQQSGNLDTDYGTLARSHPDKTETVLRQLSGEPRLAIPLLGQLAASHPERAAAFMATPEGAAIVQDARGPQSPGLLALKSWSLTDSGAAITWLRTIPAEKQADIIPFAGTVLGNLPADDWLALTRGLSIHHSHAWQMAEQALDHSRDPAMLSEWCLSFPDNFRGHIVMTLRNHLKNPVLADDLSRRIEAARSTAQKP